MVSALGFDPICVGSIPTSVTIRRGGRNNTISFYFFRDITRKNCKRKEKEIMTFTELLKKNGIADDVVEKITSDIAFSATATEVIREVWHGCCWVSFYLMTVNNMRKAVLKFKTAFLRLTIILKD